MVKCFSYQYEDSSSSLQNPHKRQVQSHIIIIPVMGKQQLWILGSTGLTDKCQVWGENLSQKTTVKETPTVDL